MEPETDTIQAQPPTPQEVEAMYQRVINSRVEACTNELSELLKKHNCRLEVDQRVRNGVPGPTQIIVAYN